MPSCEPEFPQAGPNAAVRAELWSILAPYEEGWEELEAFSFAALNAGASQPAQWYVWSVGTTMIGTSGTEYPPTEIMSRGEPVSPFKLDIRAGNPGLTDRYIVDVGVSIVMPPAPMIDVSVLVPIRTQAGAGNLDFEFPSGVVTAWVGRLSVCALPLYAPSRPSRPARCTRRVTITANTEVQVDVPPHASRLYVAPLLGAGGAEPLGFDFEYDNGGAGEMNLGPGVIGEWCPVPTAANVVAVQGDFAVETGAVLIFELEV